MSRSKQHPVLPSSYKRPAPGLASSQQVSPTQLQTNRPFSNSGLVDYNETGSCSFGALPPRPCTTGARDIFRNTANESNASVDAIWAVPAPTVKGVDAVGAVGTVGSARANKSKATFSKANVGHRQLCTPSTDIEEVVKTYLPSSTLREPVTSKTSMQTPVRAATQKTLASATQLQGKPMTADAAAQNAQLQAALSKISMQVQQMNECTSRHAKALQALTEKVTEAHNISLQTQSSVQDMNKNVSKLNKVSSDHTVQIQRTTSLAENMNAKLKQVQQENQIGTTLEHLQIKKMPRHVQV